MNLLIKHKDGSSLRINIDKLPQGNDAKVSVATYGRDGYYRATESWSDVLDMDDIRKQLECANENGSEVFQCLARGLVPFNQVVL